MAGGEKEEERRLRRDVNDQGMGLRTATASMNARDGTKNWHKWKKQTDRKRNAHDPKTTRGGWKFQSLGIMTLTGQRARRGNENNDPGQLIIHLRFPPKYKAIMTHPSRTIGALARHSKNSFRITKTNKRSPIAPTKRIMYPFRHPWSPQGAARVRTRLEKNSPLSFRLECAGHPPLGLVRDPVYCSRGREYNPLSLRPFLPHIPLG